MPIEVKELIVRAWIDSQGTTNANEAKKVATSANETTDFHAEMLEQMKRILSDKKDR